MCQYEDMNDDDDLPMIVKAVISICAAATLVLSIWCTYIAFAGGKLPLVGWELKGGLSSGFMWLIIADPILLTLGYWASALLALPLGAIFKSAK